MDLIPAVTGGLLPASAHVRSGALALRCLEWGAPRDPTVVLLHGNGGHAHWWDALVPALVPGWRVLAPDLRGHGESDWAEPPRYAVRDFAADATALLDALAPGAVALVGHSMGGRVAAWYASHAPDRIAALALLDTRMNTIDPAAAATWRAQMTGTRQGRGYPTRAAALAAFRFVPDETGVPQAVIDDLAHHAIRERAPGDWTFRFDRAVLALDGDGAGDIFPLLRHIRCPTLLMAGADSWVMDDAQRRAIADAIPGCATQVFPGGHHFLLSHAGPVSAALRAFLDGLPARGGGR